MTINKHGSFYLREGWPTKILLEVSRNSHVFSPRSSAEINAVDSFGVGRVMIKSMRYWAKAMGLTNEGTDSQGLAVSETKLFKTILNNDVYCQDKATVLLLHRNLILNREDASAWYWFFNECSQSEINKESFCSGFSAFLSVNGETYNKVTIEKEFNCLRSTYISDASFTIDKILEDDIAPFFGSLQILTKNGKDSLVKRKLTRKDIPSDILLGCILADNEQDLHNNRQISIDKLLDESCQVGRYFNITYSNLLEMLQVLENKGKIKIFNNFGNRYIEVYSENFTDAFENYYNQVDRGIYEV